jgi:hypothetical protein
MDGIDPTALSNVQRDTLVVCVLKSARQIVKKHATTYTEDAAVVIERYSNLCAIRYQF